MLKKRRTIKFKRNVINVCSKRRRVMLRNTHKKILNRRRSFNLLQLEPSAEAA